MRRPSAYRVFVTRNSEYHVRGLVCCGVRDRRSGRWVHTHWALNQALATAFRDATGRMRTLATPSVGESLQFVIGDRGLMTSPILCVEEREGIALDAQERAALAGVFFAGTDPAARETR